MPVIPYKIQKSVQRLVNGRKRWFTEYETVFIDVSDEVAVFLTKNGKYEQGYQARMKKLKRKLKIHTTFSLDEIIQSNDSLGESNVGELIADTIHKDNINPIEITIEKENKYERKHGIKYEDEDEKKRKEFLEKCAKKLTKKQYEAWICSEYGYSNVDIASMLKIDESSVRERIRNAKERIRKINPNYFFKNPRK